MRTEDQRTITETSSEQGFVRCKIIDSQKSGLEYTLKFYRWDTGRDSHIALDWKKGLFKEVITYSEKKATEYENELFGSNNNNKSPY